MKPKTILTAVFFAVLLIVFRSPSALAAEALATNEVEAIELVNAERADAGLAPLTFNASLAASARQYAAYMASSDFFGHEGPDGSSIVTRDVSAGYHGWTWLGENLAAGEARATAAVAIWTASQEHKARLLSPTAREIGVGFATGGALGYYWVVELGARSGEASSQSYTGSAAPVSAQYSLPHPSVTDGSNQVAAWRSGATGYSVEGQWLAAFLRMGGLDTLGEPRSGVIADIAVPGQTVQYFQRAVLEYHPENPLPYRIQRRLLVDLLDPTADQPAHPSDAPPGPASYLSCGQSPAGGNFVADYTRSGIAIHFRQFFEERGGLNTFGCPKGEATLREGVWTQRFQAAVFEYHPENDRDGLVPGTNVPYRNYRVQLALLGDQYIKWIGGLESH